MPSCVLRYCVNHSRNKSKSEGVTFHKFPRPGHEKRHTWIKFVQKNRSEENWLPSDYSCICSAHFKESDKYITKTGRIYLNKSAVPFDKDNPTLSGEPEASDPLSDSVTSSDSESVFDIPSKIVIKKQLGKKSPAKKKYSNKLKKVQRQKKYPKKKNATYENIVQNLKKKFGLNLNIVNDLMVKAKMVDLNNSLMKNKKQKRSYLFYTAALRKFAVTLNYHSPAACQYVRKYYNKALPHPRTICRWYSTVNAEPGFTTEAFKALKNKSIFNANSIKPVLCSLIFGEIAIARKKLLQKCKKIGAVNFGAGPMQGEENETAAKQALVFMLVALNENWKLPVGYFLTDDVNSDTKANLIKICLQRCHESGVMVVSLTFDGCSSNFGAAEILGCKLSDVNNMKTYFAHPSTGEKVCIFIDPTHVLKLIRNTFEKKRLLFANNGRKIKWQLLKNLNKLQQNENLRFGNKLKICHINFRQQIMKVKLATQLLSMNVAKTLLLCNEVLNSTQFQDSSETVNFITLINNFFDVMNSREFQNHDFKRPIDSKNDIEIFSFLEEVKSFILELKFRFRSKTILKRRNRVSMIILQVSKKKVVESVDKTGFVGAIICIESLKTLYSYIVENKKLISYISMYRLNKNHLELFFDLIRRYGGNNNNPNILEFRAAYKKTLNHLEFRSSLEDNCIPLDNFLILNSTSENIINSTTFLNRYEEFSFSILQTTRTLVSDLDAENNCNIFTAMLDYETIACEPKVIVGYISGYISTLLTKQLKCEECVNSLSTTSKLPHHTLITIKDMGGLCYSTKDVYKICLSTEKIIRNLVRQSCRKGLASNYTFNYIIVKTLKQFINKEIFENISQHSLNQPSTFNHRVHLIRAIINQYTRIRLQRKGDKERKLVLFDEK